MPSTIPFDPGLVLGQVIDETKIQSLKGKADILKVKDAKENQLQQTMLAQQRLEMLKKELINMKIDPTDSSMKSLDDQITAMKSDVAAKAKEFAEASVNAAQQMAAADAAAPQSQINEEPESPIDFSNSSLVNMDLSSDTMTMNVQYVRAERNAEEQAAHAASVSSLVYSNLEGFLSPTAATSVSGSVKNSSQQQVSSHMVEGTVVITVNCSHKRTDLFDPLNLDADKAVAAWNVIHPDELIDITDVKSTYEASTAAPTANDKVMNVLSGQSTGSSFVGLVHIVHKEDSSSKQTSSAVASSITVEIEKNLFLSSTQGKFGLDASYADNLKNLVSTSEVESYCNVVTMGSIPTIASNVIETSVQKLAPSPKDVMAQLDAIQGSNDGTVNNQSSAANQARNGESFMQLNNSYVKSVVSELGSYDNKNNKVIDMNTLMTALDDFIKEAKEGQGGVPINFFVKPITKKEVARTVMAKYWPVGYNAGNQPGGADGGESKNDGR